MKITLVSGRRAFSLMELLVVLAILAVLCSLLFPAMAQARRRSVSLQCQSNLRIIGQVLKLYENANNGWFYPVVIHPGAKNPHGRGLLDPPHLRWPMFAFKVAGAPDPPPYDPTQFHGQYDPVNFPVAPYTPAILRCPLDDDPVEAHSYVLNGYAAVRHIKAGSNDWGTKTVSEVILAGEKYSQNRDYFIERIKTLDDVFDWYHHGRTLFSNYLYFDGHVASASSADARAAIDPWADETP